MHLGKPLLTTSAVPLQESHQHAVLPALVAAQCDRSAVRRRRCRPSSSTSQLCHNPGTSKKNKHKQTVVARSETRYIFARLATGHMHTLTACMRTLLFAVLQSSEVPEFVSEMRRPHRHSKALSALALKKSLQNLGSNE